MKTGYVNLKNHFDTMIMGGRRRFRPDGYETLRDTYEIGYGIKIPLFDIYRENIECGSNEIKCIATLLGPESKANDIPYGIMVDGDRVVYAHAMNEDYRSTISDKQVSRYICEVYSAMDDIIKRDAFYLNDTEARNNMLVCVTRSLPFYLTFFHFKGLAANSAFSGDPNVIGEEASKTFIHLLEKYITGSEEDAKALLDWLLNPNNKYSDDISTIYRQMTFNNKLELFI